VALELRLLLAQDRELFVSWGLKRFSTGQFHMLLEAFLLGRVVGRVVGYLAVGLFSLIDLVRVPIATPTKTIVDPPLVIDILFPMLQIPPYRPTRIQHPARNGQPGSGKGARGDDELGLVGCGFLSLRLDLGVSFGVRPGLSLVLRRRLEVGCLGLKLNRQRLRTTIRAKGGTSL
jgi:hypothetical protein